MAKKRPSKKSAAKRSAKKKPAMKKRGSKQAAKKSVAREKATPKKKAASKKTSRRTAAESFSVKRPASRRGLGSDAGGQSGDLQGLPHRGGADSENVEELLEEGNTLEAGVVAGVEEADEADEREVHTHEVPEDDVPEEYLDRDN